MLLIYSNSKNHNSSFYIFEYVAKVKTKVCTNFHQHQHVFSYQTVKPVEPASL